MSLDSLFSPITIGKLAIQNRIVMSPMATNYTSPEGFVTDRQIAYYVERAKGDVDYIARRTPGLRGSLNLFLMARIKGRPSLNKILKRQRISTMR